MKYMRQQNTIQIDSLGGERRSDAYGEDYIGEFVRVISAYSPMRPLSVLEWGMGNSTRFFIDERETLNISSLHSIDHAPEYFNALRSTLPAWNGFHSYCLDLMGTKNSDRDPELNYSSFPLLIRKNFDLIFIDGRRRMECALTAAQLCAEDTLVILHDYRRARYQSVRYLFDIIEDGTQFRAMKIKKGLLVHND